MKKCRNCGKFEDGASDSSIPPLPIAILLEILTPIKPKLPDGLSVVGTSNGLLCLRARNLWYDVVYVINPIKGECFQLPIEYYHKIPEPASYRFGFIPSTSEFKVLRISSKAWLANTGDECEILTAGDDDGWRPFPYVDMRLWLCGISLNGAFHWIPEVRDEAPFLINTFDLAEEKAGQILGPHGLVPHLRIKSVLFNNQLSLIDRSIESQFTKWTMEEYGKVESWTKDVVLSSWFPSGFYLDRLSPVGRLKSGDILFARSTDLFCVNVKKQKCSKIGVFDFECRLLCYGGVCSKLFTTRRG